MSYFVSPVLGMSLPVAGTAQAFEIAVQNANMALIEGGFTSDRVTLGTHTTQIGTANTNITNLQTGVGRSTSTTFFPADLAGLAAITGVSSPAASNGDNAIVAEGGALFTRLAGVWVQQTPANFLTVSARDTAYAKAAAAYRVANASAYVAALSTYWPMVYTGTQWQKVGLWKPTSAVATGGTATIGDDGSVTCVFTGAGTLTLRDCFPPLSLTDITDVDADWLSVAGQTLTLKQAAAGVVDPAAAGYSTYGSGANQAGTYGSSTLLNAGSWVIDSAVSHIEDHFLLQVKHIQDPARRTRVSNVAETSTVTGTAEVLYQLEHLVLSKAQAWDGLQFAVTGAGTLVLKFRPHP